MASTPIQHTAFEIYGSHWFNGGPVSVKSAIGRVVLLFFWDYTCIKSLRLLTYIKEINQRYQGEGLLTVGIHSPEFEFGENPEPVKNAIEKLDIVFPIMMDEGKQVYSLYRIPETPTVVIVDVDGKIRDYYSGRGKQTDIERTVQQLLRESGNREDFPLPMDTLRVEESPGVKLEQETPQLYFGYSKGNLGNREGFNPESMFAYEDPGLYLPGRFYAHGIWKCNRQSMSFEKSLHNNGYIILKYEGKEVFAVIGATDGEEHILEIEQDGNPLSIDNKGHDILLDAEQKSLVSVRYPQLINLVCNEEFSERTLKISAKKPGIEFYSLTFIPDIISELLSQN